MNKAIDVSSYVIFKYNELGKNISNLKLQKVLYYIQMACLRKLGCPAFKDPIEAWMHGPVVHDIYEEFKKYISAPIDINDRALNKTVLFSPEYCQIFDDIIKRTIPIEPWDLVKKTHQTSPWKKNYIERYNRVIPCKDIADGEINI